MPTNFDLVKHLGEVFLDGEIDGTPLEGSSLRVSVPYLEIFLESLDKPPRNEFEKIIQTIAKESESKDTSENIYNLLQNIKKLTTTQKDLQKIISDIVSMQKLLKSEDTIEAFLEKEMSRIVDDLLNQFELEKEICVPQGYSIRSNG